MRFNADIHHRQSIRLPHYDYTQAGLYFITICTHERLPLFGEIVQEVMMLNSAGMFVEKCWQDLLNHYPNIELGEFVVMPNHFHGIIRFVETVGVIHESPKQSSRETRRQMRLSKLIGRFKMISAKQINQWRNNSGIPVWQRNYYEHIIRNDEAHKKITEYIQNNPAKWHEDKYHL